MAERRRVIVIETGDEEPVRTLCERLTRAGYEVILAPDEATARSFPNADALLVTPPAERTSADVSTLQRAQTFVKDALSAAARGLGAGVSRLRGRGSLEHDLRQKNRALEHLASELRRANAELMRLAVTDALTGMNNRRHFMEGLRREFQRARRYQRPLSLLLVDVDHFKQINDTYGHPVGDAVLTGLADLMRRTIRATDLSARLGGEEFAIAFVEADLSRAHAAAESLRAAVAREPFRYHDRTVQITISGGIVDSSHPQATTHIDLIEIADKALYQAKTGGRDRIVLAPGYPAA